jgi:hypothetical protein
LDGENLSLQLGNKTLIVGELVLVVMDLAMEEFTANRNKSETEKR